MAWRAQLGAGRGQFIFAPEQVGIDPKLLAWARSPLVSEVSVLKDTVTSISDRSKATNVTVGELLATVNGLSSEVQRLQHCFRTLADLVDAEVARLTTDGSKLIREVAGLRELLEWNAEQQQQQANAAGEMALETARQAASDIQNLRDEVRQWREEAAHKSARHEVRLEDLDKQVLSPIPFPTPSMPAARLPHAWLQGKRADRGHGAAGAHS